ncbi:Calcineurin-like_phosphoesterase [Hexamita inflata]|uniref:Calcineurin-like phosphoesterase n=1 Tax=Hexamita inflata TaxID=28002 RepID=A0AA86TY41_9EUKA|nr:Calcineurin-like phosphoesterase [Hexamita inflata]
MKILLFGCIHGRFDLVCSAIDFYRPDLAVLLGDLQTITQESDMDLCNLKSKKHREMGHFQDLISGKLQLSCPTICIGGNHENVKHLAVFRRGGFLCRNLFYLGAGMYQIVINNRFIDVAAISGISHSPAMESAPLDSAAFLANNFTRSDLYYLTRATLSDLSLIPQITRPALVLSHDWPLGVSNLISEQSLVKDDVNFNDPLIGGPVSSYLLNRIQTNNCVYACAHMHFYVNQQIELQNTVQFIALSKLGLENSFEVIEFEDQFCENCNGVWSGNNFFGDFGSGKYLETVLVKNEGNWELVNGDVRVQLE